MKHLLITLLLLLVTGISTTSMAGDSIEIVPLRTAAPKNSCR